MDMHYVYHPDKDAVCVDTDEYSRLLESGWYDTPTKFPAKKIAGIASQVDEKVESSDVDEGKAVIQKPRGRPPRDK